MIWLLYYAELMSFLGGALLLGMALRNIARGTASRNWPETSGTILRTFVSVQTDSEGAKGYTPSIEYEYIVEGSRHKGTRLQYGQVGSWSREHAERTIAAYAAGTSVRVFVNPRNPKDSVLLSGTSWGNLFLAMAGIVFLGAGFMLRGSRPDGLSFR